VAAIEDGIGGCAPIGGRSGRDRMIEPVAAVDTWWELLLAREEAE